MQLPHGSLASTRRGPLDFGEIDGNIGREGMNGYVRVSAFEQSAIREWVVVYLAGRPVMAFASDGAADRKDPDRRQIAEAIRRDNAIVEVCRLEDRQVRLLQDLYRELVVTPAKAASVTPAKAASFAPAPSPAKPAPKELQRPAQPPAATPAAAPKAAPPRTEAKPRPAAAPEVRGRFVRTEEIGGLDEYVQRHPGETGHLLFIAERDGRAEEEHVILVKGRIEAIYNGSASGAALLHDLAHVPGEAEFYAVDEALLASVIGRYARSAGAAPAGPEPAARPASVARLVPAAMTAAGGIGIPAKELLEGPLLTLAPAGEDFSRAMDEISGGMDDDFAMVRRVERDFACHVDELLSKLELSHLRARSKR